MKKYILVVLVMSTAYSCSMTSWFSIAKQYALTATGYYQKQLADGIQRLDVELVRYALEHGVDPNTPLVFNNCNTVSDSNVPTIPLVYIVNEVLRAKLYSIIIECRRKMVEQRCMMLNTLFNYSSYNEQLTLFIDIIRLLLDYGASIDVAIQGKSLMKYFNDKMTPWGPGSQEIKRFLSPSSEVAQLHKLFIAYSDCVAMLELPISAFEQKPDLIDALFSRLIEFGSPVLLKRALSKLPLSLAQLKDLNKKVHGLYIKTHSPKYKVVGRLFKDAALQSARLLDACKGADSWSNIALLIAQFH